jgi:UDP-3-O-[3-hydroxymyristoyl] glucosamine N-acyltransferase
MNSVSFKLHEINNLINGKLYGNGDIDIYAVSGIKEAEKGDITFVSNSRYQKEALKTKASAIIAQNRLKCNGSALIQIDNPYLAFLKVQELFESKKRESISWGVDETAILGDNVKLGELVSIQAYSVIEDDVEIGDGTVIGPLVHVGRASRIGKDCLIYSHVAVREDTEIGDRVIVHNGVKIGSDGFGFATEDGKHQKIPQLGRVVIEDDVEIGANTTIDRARMKNAVTLIKRGTKIDNLVQIAHNVEIGEDCLIVAQVGIAGSAKIGDRCTIAGQAGVCGHIEIGDDTLVYGKAGVTKNQESGAQISGFPAVSHLEDLRTQASLRKLPSVLSRLSELEKELAELKEKQTENIQKNTEEK